MELKKIDNIEDCYLFYSIETRDSNGNIVKELLKKNGDNEPVKDINDYIDKRIEYMVTKQKLFVNQIKHGLFEVSIRNIVCS